MAGQENIAFIWKKYKEKPTTESRNRLIIIYAPLVKYVAGRVSSNLPRSVEVADLISYGMFGLIDAISKFEPERDIKFETYAIQRIKGAIIDELRNLDWAPRSLRAKAKDIENTFGELESRLKREPKDKEVAAALGIKLEEYNETLVALSQTSIIGLEDIFTYQNENDEKSNVYNYLEDKNAVDPSQALEDEEAKDIVVKTVKELPEREKKVIVFYYYEGMTLKNIGKVLGVSESRISQLHAKALLRLRMKLKILREEKAN